MEQAGQDPAAPQEVTRLLTERDALTRRLTGIDQRLEALYAHRQEDLSRRLASIEEAIRELSRQGVAGTTAAPAQPVAQPVTPAAAPPPAPAAPAAPPAQAAPAAPRPATAPAVPPAQPASPRIIGERVAVDA
ncbi:MAG: hypothetical protein KDB60_04360, partial [Propionibacteriaceae bacterium]|nr:hypothetical protein [Propionibacteriaceae bacterium]